MRVLFVSDTLALGGRQRQLAELLEAIDARDDVTAFLLLLSDEVFYRRVLDLDISIARIPRRVRQDPAVFWKVYRACRAIRPDVVQACDRMSAVYALPTAKRLGLPAISNVVRDGRDRQTRSRSMVFHRLIVPWSDMIVGNSEAGLRAYCIPPEKAICIRNGYDLGRADGLPSIESVRARFGITTPHVVGMVAAMEPRKDYEAFVRIAGHILDDRTDVTFVGVGDGPTRASIEAMVQDRHRGGIRFLGAQGDVESIAQTFTVGLLLPRHASGHQEGISNAIMEYMACGVPVVSDRSGGTPEIVIDGETGTLVEANDLAEAERAIRFLLGHPREAKAMGEAGRARLETEFGVEQMVQQFVDLYASCLERTDVGSGAGKR